MPVLVFLEGRMSCGYLADGSTTWLQRLWGKWAQRLTTISCLSPKLQMFMLLGINGFDFNYIPFVRMKLTRIGWWPFSQTRIGVAFDNEIIHKYSLYGPKAHDTVSHSVLDLTFVCFQHDLVRAAGWRLASHRPACGSKNLATGQRWGN